MSRWLPHAPCGPGCVAPAGPAVSTRDTLARWARLVRVLTATRCPADILSALGVRLEADTDRLSGPGPLGTLIVANHISWLDILTLLAVEPVTFTAKREIANWPVLGRLAHRAGTLFVDRSRLRQLPATVAELAARLRAGQSVVVFAAGTTWCAPPGGEFRRATFQAALDVGAAVRPVTISYHQAEKPSTIAAFVGAESLVASMTRIITAGDLAVRIEAHPLITATADLDRRELAGLAQAAMRRAYPGGPIHA